MEIKKGDIFLCINDVIMRDSNIVAYISGNVYLSEIDTCLTDEQGDKLHNGREEDIEKYFFKINNNGSSFGKDEKQVDITKEPKPNVFVYYRGNKERGNEIIKELEKLGGKNEFDNEGTSDCNYYCINPFGIISCVNIEADGKWIEEHYTEVFLRENRATEKVGISKESEDLLKAGEYYNNYMKKMLAQQLVKSSIEGIEKQVKILCDEVDKIMSDDWV